jgi:osmotically-inducible protein OsmY
MKSNADLQKDIYEELRWDPRVHEGDIGVSVSDGIITLSGHIPSYAEKWAAEEATKKVAGVTAVANEIEVKLPGNQVKDDVEIAKAALTAIKWHVWIPQDAVKVVVNKGWVSLSGPVKFEFQRQAVLDAVRHLAGVRGVTDEISIQPAVKAKDIQYQIKQALHRHAEDDANNIQVTVTDGEVQLSGKVYSWSEKIEAEWAAMATVGVRKVKSNVQVAYK